MSCALGTLDCSAAPAQPNDGAADQSAPRAGDVETSSEIHDDSAQLSQDSLADRAPDAPAALGCADVGCSAPPLCALGCQATCGCCPCAEGDSSNLNGAAVRCTGGCYVPEADGGAACVNSAPISGPPPQVIGCYVGTVECGWQKMPCNCELDVKNPGASAARVQFALTVAPTSVIPALTGSPDVEIAFADPDGSWAATWSTQAGNGTTFAVTTAAGTTTVRLGAASLVLAAVSLSPSQSTVATANINGAPQDTTVELEAVVTDSAGHPLAFDTGTCAEICPCELH